MNIIAMLHPIVAKEGEDVKDTFGCLKLKIPAFHGTNNQDAYLECKKKIELVSICQKYTEDNKIKVVAT